MDNLGRKYIADGMSIYATTSMFNVKNIPEIFYHCYIETLYTKEPEEFEDNEYMGAYV